MNLARYTHKGWFGFCPVFIEDPHGRCPNLTSRHPLLMPILRFNVWLQELSIATCSLMAPDWEPTWSIRLTGKR